MSGAMQMLIAAADGGFVFAPTISGSVTNYILRNAALAAGWDGVLPLIATVTVAEGAVVGSTGVDAYAFDTGTGFPAGSRLALLNRGHIVGAGGYGGPGARGTRSAGFPGGVGGPALRAQATLAVVNAGVIGGGGGGGGGSGRHWADAEVYDSAPGGDGAGYIGYSLTAGSPGGAWRGAAGGTGGGLGQAGEPGSQTIGGTPGYGGAAGAAVVGGAWIVWNAIGTRLGSVS